MALGTSTTRKFGGLVYHLRVQPVQLMHHGFVDPYTIRYKRDADLIAKSRRVKGELVRVVEVKPMGYRIYYRKA